MKKEWRFIHFFTAALLGALVMAPAADAYDDLYGPGIELGAGLTAMKQMDAPGWVSNQYASGFGSAAFRIYKGLSVQGAFGFGRGGDPGEDWIGLHDGQRLWSQENSSIDYYYYGLRYEIPTYWLNMGHYGPEFIIVAAGLDTRKFKVESSVIDNNGKPEIIGKTIYDIANVTGTYYTLAGRWKIKTDETVLGDSWFGSYGLDAGVRYVRYSDSDMKYRDTMTFESTYNSLEVFILAFMKLRLFY